MVRSSPSSHTNIASSSTATKGSYLDSLRRPAATTTTANQPQPAAEGPSYLQFGGYSVRAPEEATYNHYASSRGIVAAGIWTARFEEWMATAIAAEWSIKRQEQEELGALHARFVEERPGREDEAIPCPYCGLLQPSTAVHAAHVARHVEENVAAARRRAQKERDAARVTTSSGYVKRWKATATRLLEEYRELLASLDPPKPCKEGQPGTEGPVAGQKVWALQALRDPDTGVHIRKGEVGEVVGPPADSSEAGTVAVVRFRGAAFDAKEGMVVGEGIPPLSSPDLAYPLPPTDTTPTPPKTTDTHDKDRREGGEEGRDRTKEMAENG